MPKRAAVCIGVNKPNGMTPLSAAARDAGRFEQWARLQGCDTQLITDDNANKVRLGDIYDLVKGFVDQGIYDQLLVYFSGHGILLAPGAEYWLLSGAPANPNEAVNLVRSIETARDSAIPHVAFVSDACRSAATNHILRAVHGGVIFPPQPPPTHRSEIDAYYATLPGDPANEVPQATATAGHVGLFTECLLDVVNHPPPAMVESASLNGVNIRVLSTRKLKSHLESTVPVKAGTIHIALKQQPEVQVGTALPKYFAEVIPTAGMAAPAVPPVPAAPTGPPPSSGPSINDAWSVLKSDAYATAVPQSPAFMAARNFANVSGMFSELERVRSAKGRERFETRTGFSVHGAQVTNAYSRRKSDPPFKEQTESPTGAFAHHVRVYDEAGFRAATILLTLDTGTTALLPTCPGMIGSVLVDRGRVLSVNYVPSAQSHRFQEYEKNAGKIEHMKAYAAFASRVGKFEIPDESADQFADRIRQFKGLDPMMGIYAAYGYAQIGSDRDANSVFRYMRDDFEVPVPFDVAMLGLRGDRATLAGVEDRIAPFGPMLSQGWARLDEKNAMWRPVHARLRPYLVPGLFVTLDAEGTAMARAAIQSGEVQ